ncbi:putative F420-dependent oxidoreductase [Litorivivens lipolytica]|uniref:Putative F420-dependent oxidoreductase n=1 Tax=Litorivivens lipolytica TaxID=1524264 RepID=A0A7W4W577_9GAMM|nr:TIGR03620 family F420-dependent LLM class oxidoreductase [Litorivivens lipolytica]MBB3047634.1 putative F420-dependent oxidoreductase [Litorivivens lipolytica]
MSLGKLGIWAWVDHAGFDGAAEFAREIEALGYSALWIPEAVGCDPFVTLALIAKQTKTLKLATGIANIYARDAMAMQAVRKTLDGLSGGRLVLGLGVSHPEMVSGFRHHDYGKPVSTMRRYLELMDESLYAGPQPEQEGLRLLAALRKNMLGLAAEKADGAHPYFVPVEHTARARELLGPDKLLAPEQTLLLESDPTEARRIARGFMSTYIGLQNYRNNLLTLGFEEKDFDNGGSDRLVDAIVAWGDEDALAERIREHWQAGADHVCIQTLRKDGQNGFDLEAVRKLAPLTAE